MTGHLDTYGDLRILIPLGAMFVIIFCCVLMALKEMDMFRGPSKLAVALCVSILAIWGIDQTIIHAILIEYAALGFALLIIFLVLLLLWILGLRKSRGVGYRDTSVREYWTSRTDPEIGNSQGAATVRGSELSEYLTESQAVRNAPATGQSVALRHLLRVADGHVGISDAEDKSSVNRAETDAQDLTGIFNRTDSPIRTSSIKRSDPMCLREVDRDQD